MDAGLVSHSKDGTQELRVAGKDRKFVWAEAKIVGDTVEVSSPQVKAPKAVRYAWANNAEASLFNKAGLPASPSAPTPGNCRRASDPIFQMNFPSTAHHLHLFLLSVRPSAHLTGENRHVCIYNRTISAILGFKPKTRAKVNGQTGSRGTENRCLMDASSFVTSLYTNILERPAPSSAEVASWVNLIQNGLSLKPSVQISSTAASSWR